MEEVLTRRLKHTEWEYPQLLVVDGGKGQVSAAMKILGTLGLQIPLIGLAKREETIVVPRRDGSDEHFIEISLPKDSAALTLLRRIRDEAHRFAITYHRKLRGKSALLS
jgi:excinuclease ABC subunit C